MDHNIYPNLFSLLVLAHPALLLDCWLLPRCSGGHSDTLHRGQTDGGGGASQCNRLAASQCNYHYNQPLQWNPYLIMKGVMKQQAVAIYNQFSNKMGLQAFGENKLSRVDWVDGVFTVVGRLHWVSPPCVSAVCLRQVF